MDVAGNKKTGEVLQSVLSMPGIQDAQGNELSCWQESEVELQRDEQIVWQIDTPDGNRHSVLENNGQGILQQVPISYLTTGNQNVVFSKNRKPLTYIVSQNINDQKGDKSLSKDVFLHDSQKIVVVQQISSKVEDSDISYDQIGQMTVNYVDAKLYKVDDCEGNSVFFSKENKGQTLKIESGYQLVEEQLKSPIIELNKAADAEDEDQELLEVSNEKKLKNINSLKETLELKKKRVNSKLCKEQGQADGVQHHSNDKLRRLVATKMDKKILNRKKRMRKRNVSVKNKFKSPKKSDKFLEKKNLKILGDDTGSVMDSENDKTEVKAKRNLDELTKLEERAEQVAERFKIGCECADFNCFEGLNPEKVFRHRLNIADLTKAEHDMYLMGVIMTSMQNPDETCRHKERLRIRSTYVYQGKRVCLTAFLYLEHVTLYQMKRLRKHLKYHGVSPRIHGNRGRKPANTLSLDTYQHATLFVQRYIENHYVKSVPNFTTFSSDKMGSSFVSGTNLNLHEVKKPGKETHTIKIVNKMNSYHLPPDCTKKTLHDEYKAFCEGVRPDDKIMQYSTFTSFLKKQFPNVKFQKMEKKPDEKLGSTDSKSSTQQFQVEKSKPKTKKSKKTEQETQVENCQTPNAIKGSQIGKIYVPNKAIQVPPSHVIVAPKQDSQTFIAKGQLVGNAVVKSPQIVINGQHMQICSSQNDIRLGDQVLVGSHIVNGSHTPSYTQHIYTMHNISNN